MSKRVFRNRYDGIHFNGMKFTKPSKTSQCFADEVNIHNIVEGRMTTDLPSRKPLFTGELPQFETLQDAFNFTASAKSSFEQMDAKLRARFDNSPQKMLEFCLDSRNRDEAVQLGLMSIDKPSAPVKVEVVNSPTTPAVTPDKPE